MKYANILLVSAGLLVGWQNANADGFFGSILDAGKKLIPKSAPLDVMSLEDVTLEAVAAPASVTKHKVMLAGIDDAHGNDKLKGLGDSFEQKLGSVLFKLGVDLVSVEKSNKQKLAAEIQKYEMMGTSEYRPTQAANVAIRGNVNSASWSAKYSKAEDRPRLLDSQTMFGGDGCDYTAKLAGVLAFYSVNPLERVGQSIPFEGSKTWHIDTSDVSCKATDDQIKQGYIDALDDAIKDAGVEIASKVPAYGIVEGAGKNSKGKTYYRISIKPDNGAAPDTKVIFIAKKSVAGMEAEVEVAKGTVVATNINNMAFVELDSKKDADKIKKNMLIKLEYVNQSFLGLF